jgi:hypothetical protein
VTFRVSRRKIFLVSTLLAAVGALSIALLHGAGGNSGPARVGAVPTNLWATSIPGIDLSRENFPASTVREFFVDITNPHDVAVKVGVVRYPAFRGDPGVACNRELRPRSSGRCHFILPTAVGREPVAVLVGASIPVAVTASAIWRYRRDPTPPATRVVTEEVIMPVQVHEVR